MNYIRLWPAAGVNVTNVCNPKISTIMTHDCLRSLFEKNRVKNRMVYIYIVVFMLCSHMCSYIMMLLSAFVRESIIKWSCAESTIYTL